MKNIVSKQNLSGKINEDLDVNLIQANDIRDAINTDLVELGKIGTRTNIKGTKYLSKIFAENTDVESLNILSSTLVFVKYDYDGDGVYEAENLTILIFSYDNTNKSLIQAYDTVENKTSLLYSAEQNGGALNFPPKGTIQCVYTKEQSTNYAYWEDYKNEIRKIKLEFSTSDSFIPPSASDLTVRNYSPDGILKFSKLEEGGILNGGSYQFAFRFYHDEKCTSSGWSLFTNLIPVSNGDTIEGIQVGDIQLITGASVGETVNKKIILSLEYNDGGISQFFNSIQLAIVKNTDGSKVPQTIAYITEPFQEWYNNPSAITYDGTSVEEIPVPIETIIIEDAPIEYAKDLSIKENRLFRANIKYYERNFDNGDVDYESANTIDRELFRRYKNPANSNENLGYFREEVYAFAPVYKDEYGNWHMGEVFDFNKSGNLKPSGVTVEVSSANSVADPNPNVTRFRLSVGLNSLQRGDYLSINGNNVQVAKINAPNSIDIYGAVGDFFPTTADVLNGQKGNHSNNWAWKFPSRSDNQFSILNENNLPTALGLKINNVKNHPSWAKALAIVRQKRKKNILYQTPVVNTVGALGIPTQGVGPIINNTLGEPDLSKADYRGDLDTLVPKVFAYGNAKNFYKYEISYFREFVGVPITENYVVYYPYKVNQGGDDEEGAETPNYICTFPPEFIFNREGENYYNHDFTGSESINIVDAVALQRKQIIDDGVIRVNSYSALDKNNYFYSRSGAYFMNFQETYLTRLSHYFDRLSTGVAENISIPLSSPSRLLSKKPFTSKWLKNITNYGAAESLCVQQGQANAIPQNVKSFFNTIENQKTLLLNTSLPLHDPTFKTVIESIAGNILFPGLEPPSLKLISNADSVQSKPMALWKNPELGQNDDVDFDLRLDNADLYAAEQNKISSICHIANITRGLPDSRYLRNSDEWYFTGAYTDLTQDDIENNTPKSFEVFGGDCFVEKYAVKVNNNTLRISDVYDNIDGEATDYDGLGVLGNKNYIFHRNAKLGSFENNAEFIELYIESEVNTSYHEEENQYPVYDGDEVGNYVEPYLYGYNFGYSTQNFLQKFVAKLNDCVENSGVYGSSYVWSEERIYQAESNAFSYVDGFSNFPVLNRKDLDESYGSITKIIDFGDEGLHFVQERKIRFDPINRNIIQDAGGTLTTVLGESVVGAGGIYLPFDKGSKHIRTVKKQSGIAYFVDAFNREVVSFGSKGSQFSVISNVGLISFFQDLLKDNVSEHLLSGHIDFTSDNQEYLVIKRQSDNKGLLGAIWSNKTKGWKTKLELKEESLLDMVTTGKELLCFNTKDAHIFYGSENRGLIFSEYIDSTIVFVVNKLSEFVKVFDSIRWHMTGGFIQDVDEITIRIEGDGNFPTQISWNLLKKRGGRPSPISKRNFQYFTNWIRNIKTKQKMFGRSAEIKIIIKNSEANNRLVGINEIETYMSQSYPNR